MVVHPEFRETGCLNLFDHATRGVALLVHLFEDDLFNLIGHRTAGWYDLHGGIGCPRLFRGPGEKAKGHTEGRILDLIGVEPMLECIDR